MAMLIALGPGGTRELAERALEHARSLEPVPMPLELGGIAEVADLLGCTQVDLQAWCDDPFQDVPAELGQIRKAGKVWDLNVIRAWRGISSTVLERSV